jgi:hypothetical protein
MGTASKTARKAGLNQARLRIKSSLHAGGQTSANHSRVVLTTRLPARGGRAR